MRVRFPWIFAIGQYKDIYVKKAFVVGEDRRQWHVEIVWNLNDWEINKYEFLLSSLTSISLSEDHDQPV